MNNSMLWQPTAAAIAASNLSKFTAQLHDNLNIDFNPIDTALDTQVARYQALHSWSINNIGEFWQQAWQFCDVHASRQPSAFFVAGTTMRDAQWCPDALLNYSENLLRQSATLAIALIEIKENGHSRNISGKQLNDSVYAFAAGLQHLGIKRGDCVAAVLPNGADAVIGMLATAALGAIWTSCSPDFGVCGMVDRLQLVQPKVLISTDGYWYNGKQIDTQATMQQVIDHIPSIETIIQSRYVGNNQQLQSEATILDFASVAELATPLHSCVQVGFTAPLFIMFSSGTTGTPKCIVHCHGGVLLKQITELQLHCDIKTGDRMCFYTTTGWMMWNWSLSTLACGATLVCYDGSPAYGNINKFWQIISDYNVSHMGTSPKYLASCQASQQPLPAAPNLRLVITSAAPLASNIFEWLYQSNVAHAQLAPIAGGTDILGCFFVPCPWLAVITGEMQCVALATDVVAMQEDGSIVYGAHQHGELICRQPFPSMPVYFLHDVNNQRYHDAYFAQMPPYWAHGDYISLRGSAHGIVIYGRSDATLNPAGVRIGTAELYNVVEAMDEITEALAIGYDHDSDQSIVLCVILASRQTLTDDLHQVIRNTIRTALTVRHVPRWVFAVTDIPRTSNGKKMEKNAKQWLCGQTSSNDSLTAAQLVSSYQAIGTQIRKQLDD